MKLRKQQEDEVKERERKVSLTKLIENVSVTVLVIFIIYTD